MAAEHRSLEDATFMAEGYWAESSEEVALEAVRRLRVSLQELAPTEGQPRAVSMTVVPSDAAAYWLVEAPSREILDQACLRAGLSVERIVEAIEVRPLPRRPRQGRSAPA
jgi:hypothetical protein